MGEGKTISDLVNECYETSKSHGWWEGNQNFPEKLALIHSEVSETLEEYRNGRAIREVYRMVGIEKPEGVPVELADVLIRVFDLCGYYGIDIEKAMQEKMAYNKNRPYRHGGKKA